MKWLNFHDWQSRQSKPAIAPECWHRKVNEAKQHVFDFLLAGLVGTVFVAICVLASIIFAPQP